ncbi:hypothetical protein B0H11DRAFT_2359457 [Mycena galericulata]|nr:hypothetical protein B0H11DRAFT_2359457 [Mycena galericulata]
MSNSHLDWIWSLYTTSPDPSSGMSTLRDTCVALLNCPLTSSSFIPAIAGLALHPSVAEPFREVFPILKHLMYSAAQHHGAAQPLFDRDHVDFRLVTIIGVQQDDAEAAWGRLSQKVADAMEYIQELCALEEMSVSAHSRVAKVLPLSSRGPHGTLSRSAAPSINSAMESIVHSSRAALAPIHPAASSPSSSHRSHTHSVCPVGQSILRREFPSRQAGRTVEEFHDKGAAGRVEISAGYTYAGSAGSPALRTSQSAGQEVHEDAAVEAAQPVVMDTGEAQRESLHAVQRGVHLEFEAGASKTSVDAGHISKRVREMSENSTNGLTKASLYQRTRSRTPASVHTCARAPSAESPATEIEGLDKTLDTNDCVAIATPTAAFFLDAANESPATLEAGGPRESAEVSNVDTFSAEDETSRKETSFPNGEEPITNEVSVSKGSEQKERIRVDHSPPDESCPPVLKTESVLTAGAALSDAGALRNTTTCVDSAKSEVEVLEAGSIQLLNNGWNDWSLTAEHARDSMASIPSGTTSAKALEREPLLLSNSTDVEGVSTTHLAMEVEGLKESRDDFSKESAHGRENVDDARAPHSTEWSATGSGTAAATVSPRETGAAHFQICSHEQLEGLKENWDEFSKESRGNDVLTLETSVNSDIENKSAEIQPGGLVDSGTMSAPRAEDVCAKNPHAFDAIACSGASDSFTHGNAENLGAVSKEEGDLREGYARTSEESVDSLTRATATKRTRNADGSAVMQAGGLEEKNGESAQSSNGPQVQDLNNRTLWALVQLLQQIACMNRCAKFLWNNPLFTHSYARSLRSDFLFLDDLSARAKDLRILTISSSQVRTRMAPRDCAVASQQLRASWKDFGRKESKGRCFQPARSRSAQSSLVSMKAFARTLSSWRLQVLHVSTLRT